MGTPWNLSGGQAAWTVVGAGLALLVAVMLYSFVGAIVVGVFLYYAVRPVYRRIDAYSDHPTINATVTLLAVGVPVLVILGYAALVGVRELNQLLVTSGLQQYRSALQPYLDVAALTQPDRVARLLGSRVGSIVGYANAVFTWLLRLFVATVVAFYLLRDDQRISEWGRSTFEGTPGVVPFFEGVDADLTTIYTGNLITIGITALIAIVVYTGLDAIAPAGAGIAFPRLLGLLTGVFTIVPVIGIKIIYIPYAAYLAVAAVRSPSVPVWFPVVFFVVVLVVVDSIPDFFIRSYVSKGNLHMGLVLLAYVLGTIAFGWYGLFFGPIVLVLAVHFLRDVLPCIVQDQRVHVGQE